MKKRKHHYVWEHYLRAWATDDQIWCRRAGKYFETNTENVGQRRDFYRLKELSDVDVAFVERLISAMSESAHDLARSWIPYFRIFHKMKQDWTASSQSNPEFESKLDVAINNMEEELHTAVEGPAVPILAALRQGDASSLENDETFAHFAWYIATQYMRTPSTAQSTAKAVGALAPNFNLDAAWGLLRTIFSSTMGAALYVRRNKMRLTYLRAEQPSFIAGDQPLVNARAADLPSGTPPTELEFYYPLSPHLAVSLAFDAGTRSVEQRSLTTAEIAHYNSLIARASVEQIYASTEATLRAIQA